MSSRRRSPSPVIPDDLVDDLGGTTAVDTDVDESNAPDDYPYVTRVVKSTKPLPPITWANWYKNVEWISSLSLSLVPIIALYGMYTTPLERRTLIFSVVYYFFSGLGITAGYHRYWAHRSYNASLPLQYFLMLGGSAAVQGSIKWWSRGHRAHHRFVDTDLDPYSAHKGFWHSHMGWMLVKPRRKPGYADVSDLVRNPVVKFQRKFYVPLLLIMAFVVPTLIAGFGWGDWRGGYFFAGAARLFFVQQSTFCVNSLAHWLGDAPFDDKHTPRDHFITALVTCGEGYHNFHHEFPQDFRNAVKWYQYDPTKWFISFCKMLGLASELKTFPDNEIRKGVYNMKLKALQRERATIQWPKDSNDLPILTWEEFEEQCKERELVVIGGFIHDVGLFLEREEHPGMNAVIKAKLGKDATNAFNGGYYNHSNAAHNLLAMMRVGVISGGYEVESLKKKPKLPIDVKVYDGPTANANTTATAPKTSATYRPTAAAVNASPVVA